MNILVTEATPLFASKLSGFPNPDGYKAKDSLDAQKRLFSSGKGVSDQSSRYIYQLSDLEDGQSDVSLMRDSLTELYDHLLDSKSQIGWTTNSNTNCVP